MINLFWLLLISYKLVAQYEFPLYPVNADTIDYNSPRWDKAFGYWIGAGEGDFTTGPMGLVADSKGNIIVLNAIDRTIKVIKDGKIVSTVRYLKQGRNYDRWAMISIDSEDNIYLFDCAHVDVVKIEGDTLRNIVSHKLYYEPINGLRFEPHSAPLQAPIINGKVYIPGFTSTFRGKENPFPIYPDPNEGFGYLCMEGDKWDSLHIILLDTLIERLKGEWKSNINPSYVLRVEGDDLYLYRGVCEHIKKGEGVVDSLSLPHSLSECRPFADKKGRIYTLDWEEGDIEGKVTIRVYEPER